ncbi:MAG: hypothetical protein II939_03340 [Bacteroidales bacterium]|nr:hypothetical protein [Bacteroidales bacterium]
MDNLDDINLLKEAVEQKFGAKILYAKDCAVLSDTVFEATGNKISETTIKRLWNLVASVFNPSKYTLNSFSKYIGYEDWEDFVTNRHSVTKNAENIEKWELIRQKARAISYNSFLSVKNRMGVDIKKMVHRKFATDMMEGFLKSDKTATAFIAPGGYGKSTIMSNLVNDFFLGENPRYPDDIVWFMDCGVLDNVADQDFNVEQFILRLLGYGDQKSFKEYFLLFPAAMRGRIVLVFDGLNEFSGNAGNTRNLINNILSLIASNMEDRWFKVVLALRPDLWNYICRALSDSAEIKSTWYGVEFSTSAPVATNVPLLKMAEVEQILRNSGVYEASSVVNIMQDGIMSITRIPYFLHLYISLAHDNSNVVSDTDLLREFVSRRIIGTENGERKLKLIDFLLFSTNYGLDNDIVVMSSLQNLLTEYRTEFDELVSLGVLFEYKTEDKFLTTATCIKFSHQILFEFLLANYWLRETKFDRDLFAEVSDFYSGNPSLKFQIVSWLIKYAFKDRRTDILSGIFDILEKNFADLDDQTFMQKLTNTVGTELRKYPELRDEVIPAFAAATSGRFYYFMHFCDVDSLNAFFGDALKIYIKNSVSVADKMFAYTLKIQQGFFNRDPKIMQEYFTAVEALDIPHDDNVCYIEFMSVQVLYYSMNDGRIPASLLDYISNFAHEYYNSSDNLSAAFTYGDIILADSLFLAEQWHLVKDICELILNDKHHGHRKQVNEYYQQLQLLYAYALLRAGYTKKAHDYFAQVSEHREAFPICATNYWNMRYCEIAAAFASADSDIHSDFIKKGLAISKYLKFSCFEKRFQQMLRRLKTRW